MSRDVCKSIVEVLKVLNLLGLAARYLLGLTKVLEVFVVGIYFHWLRSTKEERVSHLESKDDSSKFFVMCIIISFSREEASIVEPNGVNPIIKLLSNDSTKVIARGISFKDKLLGPIWGSENWYGDAYLF